MRKALLSFLAFISCCQVVFAAQNYTPDEFLLYPKDPDVINPKKLVYELKPGDELTEQIILKSLAPNPKKFTLYISDRTMNKEGVSIYTQQYGSRTMAKWMNVDPEETLVNNNEEKTVNLHIKIPKDAPLDDYNGGLAAVKVEPSANMPNIQIAVRVMLDIDLKITNAPQHIKKLSETTAPTPYFYGSLGLFGGSMGYYFYTNRKEKKLQNEDRRKHKNKV